MLCTDMTLCSVHNMLCSVSFWLRHCSPCLLLEIRRVNEEYFKCCIVLLYCRALTKRSISQNFQNLFFCIIHISLTFSILCQKILAENRLQAVIWGPSKHSIQFFVSVSTIKTLYPTLGCIIHQI